MKREIILILFLIYLHNVCAQDTYTNPVGEGLLIADPYVLRHGDDYFLYGTSAGDGFKAWKSTNLLDWKPVGYVYQRTEGSWGEGSFWAPEVIGYNNRFYMIYSSQGHAMFGKGLRLCLAVSDKPEGPFEDIYAPLFDFGYGTIDGHLFIEDDTPYLYYEMVGAVGNFNQQDGFLWGAIFGVELTKDLSMPVHEPILCIYPSQSWEGINSFWARSNEGMTVFKHDSVYYMTYSGNHYRDPNYGVGYATSKKPVGGLWTKHEGNPILKNNLDINVSGPGHNSIVYSPDSSELFIVYHSHDDVENPSGKRVLNIDRLVIESDGTLKVVGPTRTPQRVPRLGF